ncbi:MAG: hypothetical protein JWQ27_3248 [Ferruginibacter sp.]|nr:hypothetical protein [Ferruginibacter sp.]
MQVTKLLYLVLISLTICGSASAQRLIDTFVVKNVLSLEKINETDRSQLKKIFKTPDGRKLSKFNSALGFITNKNDTLVVPLRSTLTASQELQLLGTGVLSLKRIRYKGFYLRSGQPFFIVEFLEPRKL